MTESPVRRLAMLADLFEAPSREFLSKFHGEWPGLALDLGCGTGHSTRLVHEEVHPNRTVGIDTSAPALDAARSATAAGSVSYLEHDVTDPPFPPGSPDFAYSRFLLAHVPDPVDVVRRWAVELRPGGLLLLDEGTSVRTVHEPIGRYLEILGGLLVHRGTATDVDAILDAVVGMDGLTPCMVRRRDFTPPANAVAAMFRANMDTWAGDPYITTTVGPEAFGWVGGELEALAASDVTDGVTWGLRQVALERA